MSSNSRPLGDKKPPEGDEPPQAKKPSPGRYSLSTEGPAEAAAVRIDSTRMPAVRPDGSPVSRGASPPASRAGAPPAPPRRDESPKPPPSVPRVSGAGVRPQPPNAPPPRAQLTNAGAAPPIRRPTIPTTAAPQSELLPIAPRSARLPSPSTTDEVPSKPPPSAASAPPGRPGSLRPPPPPRRLSSPPKAASKSSPEIEGFEGFDEGSIAHAFDALLSEGTVNVPGQQQSDLSSVRELFAELAANHMRHVRDFMIDVKWGEAPRDWIEICIPAVISLSRAASRLDLDELGVSLMRFKEQLEVARVADGPRAITGETKEQLLDTYGQLVATLPQAFALDRDKSQREAVIIQSLLLSIPDVRKVTIDKLHAAGLTSLQTLFEAKADEVAQVAGVPESLAQRIVERFQAYRRELANASPQDARAAERERLATLTLQLKEQHDGYEDAAKGWTVEAKSKKRDLFRAREETWLAISLLLARFGEVDRLNGIEKVPFAQRIAQLTEYLEEAREKYRLEV